MPVEPRGLLVSGPMRDVEEKWWPQMCTRGPCECNTLPVRAAAGRTVVSGTPRQAHRCAHRGVCRGSVPGERVSVLRTLDDCIRTGKGIRPHPDPETRSLRRIDVPVLDPG